MSPRLSELFPHGRLYMTDEVCCGVGLSHIVDALRRHLHGDWGEVPDEDARANNRAVREGGRLLSAYDTPGGRIWVITEADRSATTVLFPHEY